jgi:hypothetical protein
MNEHGKPSLFPRRISGRDMETAVISGVLAIEPTDLQRQHPRYGHDARASVSIGGVTLHGWTMNVSRGGVRIMVETDAHPVSRELEDATVVLSIDTWPARFARVAWQATVPGGLIIGLRFVESQRSEQSGSAGATQARAQMPSRWQ